MHARRVTIWLTAWFAAVFFFAWFALGQSGRRVDDAAIRNASKTGEEWLTYGGNPQEQRYSPLKVIDTSNVGRLGLVWSYEAGQGGGGQEATPMVSNGTIYSITNYSIVFAVDARTGKEKWRWDPEYNRVTVVPKICCGIVNRGLAIYDNKVIAPVNDGRLVALDAESGKPVWEARVAYPQDNYTLTMAPRIAKGKVIIGVSGSEYPVRGFFAAYDAKTGQFAWRDYTVPGDPSKPFENEAMRKAAATWDKDSWKMGGGATVWDGMAYDPDLNLLYVGTGNAGPWPDEIRKSNGRDNLYAASVLAVNPDNGEMKWYFQMVPDDSWDYDSVQQLMLVDLNIKGRMRKVIMQANKDGFFYVIDRQNGEFISGQPFVQVSWAKGLDEKTGRPIVTPEAKYGKDSVMITPGAGGAHNWAPMSFNPATGLVYIPSSNGGMGYAVQQDFKYDPARQNMGISFNFGPPGGRGGPGGPGGAAGRGGTNVTPEVAAAAAAAPPPPPAPAPPKGPVLPLIGPPPAEEGGRGQLRAWDPVMQQKRWDAPIGGGIGGGTITTAGNLVIQVSSTGHLLAYSADKGEKLLDINTGLRSSMAPPITYVLDGKQYIAFMGGQGIVQGRGPGAGAGPGGPGPGGPGPAGPGAGPGAPAPAATPAPADQAPGRGGNTAANVIMPKLLVFALDGKAPLPDPVQ
ncbi:MAG: PQQ-dependent dehydrogenase, methanol/ethanol family [Bryobacterales bacterium]|nr:PQQ-dependent dehydrogenase, methanol/ethanol family [Bryobacterales bacterium]MBV9397463.1 PQQ-dependent dehydrogenase, methanol/ethanol family [Bryobacterales bacterium]